MKYVKGSQTLEYYKTQVLAWDRHKNVEGLNRSMGYQPQSNATISLIVIFWHKIKLFCVPVQIEDFLTVLSLSVCVPLLLILDRRSRHRTTIAISAYHEEHNPSERDVY
jgi:hypothetical protein